ncbi:MAG TPA: FecR domain-containing protein [Planctomycetota bacterium]|nr:FecR domain-containing protein [Planctomycetota bacterium]
MNRNDPEELLRAFEGPQPRPETTRAIMDAAREAIRPAPVAPPRPQRLARDQRAVAVRRPRRVIRWPFAAAAAIVIAAAAGVLLHTFAARRTRDRDTSPLPTTADTIATVKSAGLRRLRGPDLLPLPVGAPLRNGDQLTAVTRADIAFIDGSTVRVDRGARLAVTWVQPDGPPTLPAGSPLRPGDQSGRPHIELTAGRIFVRVPPGNGTFTVSASAAVRVAGTIFGVEERNDRTAVNVLDGRVSVESAGTAIELTRGESGSAPLGQAPVADADDPNRALAWARDPTKFEERPLGEVLDWLEQNSSFRFTVTPGALRQVRVNLAVMDEPMQQVVEALSLACGLNVAINESDVAITGKE